MPDGSKQEPGAAGIAAFTIHTGHDRNLRITRWIFGSATFFP